jgi:hypothetical protein
MKYFRCPHLTAEFPTLVIRNLPDSGVSNPVTAVLLNFRAYDTLLGDRRGAAGLVGAESCGRPSSNRAGNRVLKACWPGFTD